MTSKNIDSLFQVYFSYFSISIHQQPPQKKYHYNLIPISTIFSFISLYVIPFPLLSLTQIKQQPFTSIVLSQAYIFYLISIFIYNAYILIFPL